MFGYSKSVILNGILISYLFNAQQNSNEYYYNSQKMVFGISKSLDNWGPDN